VQFTVKSKTTKRHALFIVGKYRVYVFRQKKKKVVIDEHFLDIKEIAVPTDSQAVFTTKNTSFTIETPKRADNLVGDIFATYVGCFPLLKDQFPLKVGDSKRYFDSNSVVLCIYK
jgi:hypothetical protein